MTLDNCDGFVENIYSYLWLSDPIDHQVPSVLIPDTIIYKNNNPSAWYFSLDGKIKFKAHQNLNAEKIIEVFTKRHNPIHEAVAVFIEKTKVSNQVKMLYHFMNLEQFRSFMDDIYWMKEGILQRFIPSKGVNHSIIRCTWSPHLCHFEFVQNKWPMNARVDLYQKSVTFEDHNAPVEISSLISKPLTQRIETHLFAIVQHLKNVSIEKINVSRMVVILCITPSDQLYFVACTNLRISSKQRAHSDKQLLKPIYDNIHVHVPPNIDQQKLRDITTKNVQKDQQCASCDKLFSESNSFQQVTFKEIIKYSIKRENQLQIGKKTEPQSGSESASRNQALRIKQTKLIPLPDNQGIPALIRKFMPTLRTSKYANLKNNPGFLQLTLGVCQECFVQIHDRCYNTYTLDGIHDKYSYDTKVYKGTQELQPEKITVRRVNADFKSELLRRSTPLENKKQRKLANLVGLKFNGESFKKILYTEGDNLDSKAPSVPTTRVWLSPTESSGVRQSNPEHYFNKARPTYQKIILQQSSKTTNLTFSPKDQYEN